MPSTETRLRIPRGAERFLALQRTRYQHPINHLFRKLRVARFYDRYLLPIIESQRNEILAASYERDLEDEYRSLAGSLPTSARKILDIGCGIAGIDLLLSRHYGSSVEFHLLDRDGTSEIYYDFEQQGAFYNSLALARRFLEINGIDDSRIHTYETTREGFPGTHQFDLIVSLISWGFHYPVSVYAEQVRSALSPNGAVILDVRRGSGGLDELRRVFGTEPTVLKATPKFDRVRFSARSAT